MTEILVTVVVWCLAAALLAGAILAVFGFVIATLIERHERNRRRDHLF